MGAARRGSFRDLRGRALWAVVGCLVCQLGLGWGYALNPLAPDVLEAFGWSRAMFSSARGPQIAAMALASPVVGALALRFGARPVVVASVLLLGASFAGLAGMQAFWQYQLWSLLLGLALTGVGDVVIGAVVAQWVTRARGLALGIVYTGSNLGGTFATALAAAVAARRGWREALVVLAAAGVLLLLPFALGAVREPRAGERARDEASPTPEAPGGVDEPTLSLSAALRTRSFWAIALGLFACLFYHLGTTDHLVLFLTDSGLERADAAAALSTAIGLGVVSKVLYGLVADRMHPQIAMLLNTALLAASSLLLLFAPERGFLRAFLLAFGIAAAARDVTYPLLVAHCFGARTLAQVYGALMVMLLPAGILGPVFAGFCHDAFGSYRPAFASFAALNLLALAALATTRRETPSTGGRASSSTC